MKTNETITVHRIYLKEGLPTTPIVLNTEQIESITGPFSDKYIRFMYIVRTKSGDEIYTDYIKTDD